MININSRLLLFLFLFLTFAFSVVGWSVVINAIIKSGNESSYIKSVSIANGAATVDVDYHDIYTVCGVIAGASALLTLLSLTSAFSLLLPIGKKRGFVRLQALFMIFGAVFLLATLIACDVIFATRSTKISATVAGMAVPQSTIQKIEQIAGVSTEYRKQSYLKLVAILPWFAVLFATLSAALLYRTASNIQDHAAAKETDTEKMARPSDTNQA